ncbi:unnamed protein product [Sphenostylis stenocarpa]|uniref:Uncharacterized protein n=1 Tax=Sphenostylis stenocarpa TaxID=92480 RepID=A0AA86RLJ7_9FABA|nr:unnamed protein product [Sphenostylis stenocarpa]
MVLEMVEGKAVVRETDMSEGMKNCVMELTHQALDAREVSDSPSIAHFITDGKDFRESREETIEVMQKA